MDRIFIRQANERDLQLMLEWLRTTKDGDLFDDDVLAHPSTFVLAAFSRSGVLACCPIQQPLMMENLIFRPGLSQSETAAAITRLAEHAVERTIERDAGELYFLCRDESTCQFAERHLFADVGELGLKTYRLNLRATFPC